MFIDSITKQHSQPQYQFTSASNRTAACWNPIPCKTI